MEKVPGKDIMQRVRRICGTSVDDARIDIQNQSDLTFLDLCLQYESQCGKRSTMMRNLRSRIRKLEKGTKNTLVAGTPSGGNS